MTESRTEVKFVPGDRVALDFGVTHALVSNYETGEFTRSSEQPGKNYLRNWGTVMTNEGDIIPGNYGVLWDTSSAPTFVHKSCLTFATNRSRFPIPQIEEGNRVQLRSDILHMRSYPVYFEERGLLKFEDEKTSVRTGTVYRRSGPGQTNVRVWWDDGVVSLVHKYILELENPEPQTIPNVNGSRRVPRTRPPSDEQIYALYISESELAELAHLCHCRSLVVCETRLGKDIREFHNQLHARD